MTPLSVPHPVTPEGVDQRLLEPSAAFKREVIKVLRGIILFMLLYLILIAMAIGLAALCAIGGMAIVAIKPMLITIMLGLGLAGLGIMVVFFLIKFLFTRRKDDHSGLIEIRREDQPRLFDFVAAVAKETKTPFPKRIYLSADVNASVSYDSTFWSMFLPVRKNLVIGLGLVNSVNLSEFKAVIAHEFGHFSQRSMKLGTYVYNMNKIIFNLLYDNDGYEETLQRWADSSGYFGFFAVLTAWIIKQIQWIMQQAYAVLNKQYLSLSRQMEFHADTVSTSVSGGNHIISSLRRLEVASITYNSLLEFYQGILKKNLRPDNIYPQHREMLRAFAAHHGLPLEQGLPLIAAASFKRFNYSRIVIKDQWASHPSTDDREIHVNSLKITAPSCLESAWSIFVRPGNVQRMLTDKLLEAVQFEEKPQPLDETTFRKMYQEEIDRYRLPAIYKGFYNERIISTCDVIDIEKRIQTESSLEQVLSDKVLALPHRLVGIQSDLQTLSAIKDKNNGIKNFEFDGVKYTFRDVDDLTQRLQQELHETEGALSLADQKLIAWFLKTCTPENREQLRAHYTGFFSSLEESNDRSKIYGEMYECLSPLYQVQPTEEIPAHVLNLKRKESRFQNALQDLLKDPAYSGIIEQDHRTAASEYLAKDWKYFVDGLYVQPALDQLHSALFVFVNAIGTRTFYAKSEILKKQLELVGMDVEERSEANGFRVASEN